MSARKDRKKIVVQPGDMPPDRIEIDDVVFEIVSVAENKQQGIKHYVYRSCRSGWTTSFTDRDFMVGVEAVPRRSNGWRSMKIEAENKSAPHAPVAPAWGIPTTRPLKKKKKRTPRKDMARARKRMSMAEEDLFI